MKTNLFKILLCVTCLAGLLAACSDEDYNGPSPDEITANYSNKLAVGNRANLKLIYSGREFIGKEVNFNTSDAQTATITLKGVFPGELTPIENVRLTADGNNGYTFSGAGTGVNGATFNYQGRVSKDSLSLNLSDVKLPQNRLTNNGTWYPTAFHVVSDNKELAGIAGLLETIVGNLLTWFVHDVTFNADGNITARYAPGLPEGKAITDLLLATSNRKESEWISSPLNLASYCVKDDSLLYIVPNIDMIIRQIEQNQAETKAGIDSLLTTDVLMDVYGKIQQWTNQGIKLVIRSTSQGTPEGKKGELFLFLDKNEIKELLPLLPLVETLIPEDMMSGLVGSIIKSLLNGIVNGMQNSQTLEIGLILSKDKNIPETQAAPNAASMINSLFPELNDKSKSN